jgi:hypothetical protein
MAVKEPWNINLGYPVDCACETADRSVNWTNITGNSVNYTYYTGVAAGNPSGDTNNVETAEYFTGATLVFTQTFIYNANNNVTSVVTT